MDKETFTNAVLDSEQTLYRIAKSILKQDADCADAVQEAILKAYSKLNSLREERYFKTWLCRILIRECYKIYNHRSDYVPLEQISEISDSSQGMGEIYESIMELDKKLRPVVVMYYIEGFSTEETAAALGIAQGTVKSRLSRARKQLRQILESEEALCYEKQ